MSRSGYYGCWRCINGWIIVEQPGRDSRAVPCVCVTGRSVPAARAKREPKPKQPGLFPAGG